MTELGLGDLLRVWRAYGHAPEALPALVKLLDLGLAPPATAPVAPATPAAPAAPAAPGQDREAPAPLPAPSPREGAGPRTGEAVVRLNLLPRVEGRPSSWSAAPELPAPGGRWRRSPMPLLFSPRRARTLLAELARVARPGGALDVDRAVELLAERRPLAAIPRRTIGSLSGGAQLVIDRSRWMEPFAADRSDVRARMIAVVGSALAQHAWRDEPGRGPPWRPPPAGVPIIALTDLGEAAWSSGRPLAMRRWAELVRAARQHGNPVTVVKPGRSTAPPWVTRHARLVSWDHRTRVGKWWRERARMAPPAAASAAANDPWRCLAVACSAAARLDIAVIRRLRMALCPELDAEAERMLWFADFVQARTSAGLTIAPDALDELRAELVASGRLTEVLAVLDDEYRGAPPLLALEHRLVSLGLSGADAGSIELGVGSALVALTGGSERTDDIAGWALRALPRLPRPVRGSAAAWALRLAAEHHTGLSVPLGESVAGDIDDLAAALAPVLRATKIAVRRGPGWLELSEPLLGEVELDDGREPTFEVPATTPRIVEVGDRRARTLAAILPGQRVRVQIGDGDVELRNLRGERWRVSLESAVAVAPEDHPADEQLVAVGELLRANEVFGVAYRVTAALVATAGSSVSLDEQVKVRLGGIERDAEVVLIQDGGELALLRIQQPVVEPLPWSLGTTLIAPLGARVSVLGGDGAVVQGTFERGFSIELLDPNQLSRRLEGAPLLQGRDLMAHVTRVIGHRATLCPAYRVHAFLPEAERWCRTLDLADTAAKFSIDTPEAQLAISRVLLNDLKLQQSEVWRLWGSHPGRRWIALAAITDERLPDCEHILQEAFENGSDLERREAERALEGSGRSIWTDVAARHPIRIEASPDRRSELAVQIAASHNLRLAGPGEVDGVAMLRLANDEITIEDQHGPLFPAAAFPAGLSAAISNLENLSFAHSLRQLEGEHGVLAGELEIEWGVVAEGELRPLPDRGAALGLRDRLYARIQSRTKRRLFVQVFNIGLRGKITRITRSFEGVELSHGGSELIIGQESGGAVTGLPLSWPKLLPDGRPRFDELVVIATLDPINLSFLQSREHLSGPDEVRGSLDRFVRTRDASLRQIERADRFFLKRLTFLLYPSAAPEEMELPVMKNPDLREGAEFPATVVFVVIKGLKDCSDAPQVPNALRALNEALRDVDAGAFVLSTIAGVIVVVSDTVAWSADDLFKALDQAKVGLALKVGVTHGTVEVVKDIDDEPNLIGPPINIAARLATSSDNPGLLVHESYAEFVDATLPASHWLHRSRRKAIPIAGKPQDPKFVCLPGPHTFDAKLPAPQEPYSSRPAVLVAYDLPKFSAGDRAQLRQRFTRLVHVFKKLRQSSPLQAATALLSPGGDGGVLVLEGVNLPDAAAIASRLRSLTEIESLDLADAIAVETRIGVHYGPVAHYVNARGISRPTGLTVFVADEIASDDHARSRKGIIFTRLLADSLTAGSNQRLASEFEALPRPTSGPASGVDRFVLRSANPQSPSDRGATQLGVSDSEHRQHESHPAHPAHATPSPRHLMKKQTNSSPPSTTNVSEWKGKIDFGIITIREDEFEAMLQRVPEELGIVSGRRQYNIRRLATDTGDAYTVAIVRSAVQGNGEAQQVANALLDELTPRWLLVVGIAGGAPASEFTLGDVVVSTQVCDFNVGAALKDKIREYALQGWPTHPDALKHAANVSAISRELGAWNDLAASGIRRPKVEILPKNLYGSPNWRKKVKESLEHHFKRTRKPKVTAGAIACSDLVMKDADLFQVWLKIARQVIAVEMESAGVHRAAHDRQVPFLSIRGISDVVGFRRDPAWTAYACHSAAAFTCAFLRTRPIPVSSSPIVAADPQ